MKKIVSAFVALITVISIFIISVVPASAINSTMSISSARYPEFLDLNMSFSISGKITSNSTITYVEVGIYKTNGTGVIVRTRTPNSTTYDISAIDPYISFGSLSEGNYVYKVIASDKNITNKVLLSKNFVVGEPNGSIADEMTDTKFKLIDISYCQTNVDWNALKKEIDTVILRAAFRWDGSYKIAEDDMFAKHYENAKKAGMKVGVYFYSIALTAKEAIEEAKFTLDVLKKYNCDLSMPVYIDMEEEAQYYRGRQLCTEIAKAFCETIKEAGYMPGIYCSKSWAEDVLLTSALTDYTMWIAHYASACGYKGRYEMWQYSEKGSINGINGYVDLDICYKDIAGYIKKMGDTPITPPTPEIQYADYTKLDNLLKAIPDLSIYEKTSRQSLEAVITKANKIDRKLPVAKQSTVDSVVTELKTAICSLKLAGSFGAAAQSGIKFDDVNGYISGIPSKTTSADFLEKYLILQGDVTVEFENLSTYITTTTVIQFKINGVTIAEYKVKG